MSVISLWVRSTLFFFAFLFWAFVPAVAFLWILLGSREAVFAAVRFWQSGFAWLSKTILGLDYKVVNAHYVPEGACIIAAKHQSAFETCILNVLFGNPAIVLKKELTLVPIWGWYAKASGLIPIDRKAGVKALAIMMAAARKAKEDGRKIVIFPQGTRLKPGVRKPYKVGVAGLYQELDLPVIPMAVNSGLFWPKGAFLKKPGTVTIEFLPPIPAGLARSAFLRRLEAELESASDRIAGV
jgi:1-acyl-sn-glycerol-3-phosphate acyltransferase